MANRLEATRGAFFEARFKSVAILDEKSLLAVCTYIDLNPLAARLAAVPEASTHTSIQQRVTHVEQQGRLDSAEGWQPRLLKLSVSRLLARFSAASRQCLRDVADHLCVHNLDNLAGCRAQSESPTRDQAEQEPDMATVPDVLERVARMRSVALPQRFPIAFPLITRSCTLYP